MAEPLGPGKFSSREEWKEYMVNFLSFNNRTGETLQRLPGQVNGQNFQIDKIKDCCVMLLDHSAQVFIDEAVNCSIFIGPCEGSVFLRKCRNCTLTIACNQFRARDCHNCTTFLYCKTDPVIETSNEMFFGNFNGAYPKLPQHFTEANLDPSDNHWDHIFDFDKADMSIPLPHWELLEAGVFMKENRWTPFGWAKLREAFFSFSKNFKGLDVDEMNAFQKATGSALTLASKEQMQEMLSAADIDLTVEGYLSFLGFSQLYSQQGVDQFKSDLRCLGIDPLDLPKWIVDLTDSSYPPPVNPVPGNATAKTKLDPGLPLMQTSVNVTVMETVKPLGAQYAPQIMSVQSSATADVMPRSSRVVKKTVSSDLFALFSAAEERGVDLKRWFEHLDEHRTGILHRDAFERAMTGLGLSIGLAVNSTVASSIERLLRKGSMTTLVTHWQPQTSSSAPGISSSKKQLVDYVRMLRMYWTTAKGAEVSHSPPKPATAVETATSSPTKKKKKPVSRVPIVSSPTAIRAADEVARLGIEQGIKSIRKLQESDDAVQVMKVSKYSRLPKPVTLVPQKAQPPPPPRPKIRKKRTPPVQTDMTLDFFYSELEAAIRTPSGWKDFGTYLNLQFGCPSETRLLSASKIGTAIVALGIPAPLNILKAFTAELAGEGKEAVTEALLVKRLKALRLKKRESFAAWKAKKTSERSEGWASALRQFNLFLTGRGRLSPDSAVSLGKELWERSQTKQAAVSQPAPALDESYSFDAEESAADSATAEGGQSAVSLLPDWALDGEAFILAHQWVSEGKAAPVVFAKMKQLEGTEEWTAEERRARERRFKEEAFQATVGVEKLKLVKTPDCGALRVSELTRCAVYLRLLRLYAAGRRSGVVPMGTAFEAWLKQHQKRKREGLEVCAEWRQKKAAEAREKAELDAAVAPADVVIERVEKLVHEATEVGSMKGVETVFPTRNGLQPNKKLLQLRKRVVDSKFITRKDFLEVLEPVMFSLSADATVSKKSTPLWNLGKSVEAKLSAFLKSQEGNERCEQLKDRLRDDFGDELSEAELASKAKQMLRKSFEREFVAWRNETDHTPTFFLNVDAAEKIAARKREEKDVSLKSSFDKWCRKKARLARAKSRKMKKEEQQKQAEVEQKKKMARQRFRHWKRSLQKGVYFSLKTKDSRPRPDPVAEAAKLAPGSPATPEAVRFREMEDTVVQSPPMRTSAQIQRAEQRAVESATAELLRSQGFNGMLTTVTGLDGEDEDVLTDCSTPRSKCE